MPQVIAFLLLLLSWMSTSRAGRCYYPNGESNNDEPCDPDAEDSACCGASTGSMCMSNKLCQGSNGTMIRGSCTDKNWGSEACPLFCLNADQGGTDLIPCANVTQIDTSYCCDHAPFCCDTGRGMFDVLPTKPRIWAVWDDEADRYSVVGTVLSDNKPTTTLSTSSAPHSTSEISTSTTSLEHSTSVVSDALSGPSSTAESSQDTSGTSTTAPELSTGAKIGIGVGAGIGAILIAAVAYLLWKVRRNGKDAKEKGNPPSYSANATIPTSWYAPKLPSSPQELHGHQGQGYGVRAELS